ncbi:MAG: anti-sigma factor antagonist [Candidatus Sumerlaeia bacterium]|nr:anti-sigma factor antagonist [Candidatus Sumerlaeia bacterium]
MALDIKIYEADGVALVRLSGKVILDECDHLKSRIIPLVTPQIGQINLDLSGVEFIDSAGLGAFVGIKVTSNKHRARLALLNPSKEVANILMVSKLDSIFDILTGAEAQGIIESLAQEKFEKDQPGAAPPSTRQQTPSVPSMPTASANPALATSANQTPAEQIDSLCRQAVEFMKAGNYDGAAQAYQRVLQLNPNYVPALNNLAIVYEKRPEWHEQAAEQWKRVLEISTANNDQKHIDRAKKHLDFLASQKS